jgi:NDP-sugar pyrophosphorylase family protein
MPVRDCLAGVDVLVLAGGLGTRLREVLPDAPKVLAPVGERVFLDVLLDWLMRFGARRVVLALGHRADEVQRHAEARPRSGLEIVSVVEPEPLGTAGAIRLARAHVHGATALVTNGDSFVDADLCAFLAAHRAGGAEVTLLCTRVPDSGRYGTVEIDGRGRITRFREKVAGQGAGTINAGVYLMERSVLNRLDGGSLERDVFQKQPAGALGAYVGDFPFIDIGTPDDLRRAAGFFEERVL